MIAEFNEAIEQMAQSHKRHFLPNEDLNKKLKLLSVYIEGLINSPAEKSQISTHHQAYLKYADSFFEQALRTVGFNKEGDSLVFTGNLEEVTENKAKFAEVLFSNRHFTLAEISELVQKNEKPPGIKEINDSVIEASPTASVIEKPKKPWED